MRFIEARIPGIPLPADPYAAIISNSLLHHLHRPAVLWETIAVYASAGTRIYVADLLRPPTTAVARQMVDAYAAGEPESCAAIFIIHCALRSNPVRSRRSSRRQVSPSWQWR